VDSVRPGESAQPRRKFRGLLTVSTESRKRSNSIEIAPRLDRTKVSNSQPGPAKGKSDRSHGLARDLSRYLM
jgi:hypothetical protein